MAANADLWEPILSGLGGAGGVWLLARASARARPDRRGWRHVRPGALHWTGLVLSGGLVGLMGYIGLFVGSSRPDAAFQMQVLWLLVAAFGAGALVCLWQMRAILRADITWRGGQIAFAARGGRQTRALAEVTSLRAPLLGRPRIGWSDGAELRLDAHATGVAELLERIEALRGGEG